MTKFINYRIAGVTLLLVFLSAGFFTVSSLEVFPCLSFVYDSQDGFMFDICSLIDDDGNILFAGDPSGYSAIPSIWTWLVSSFLLLILPYLVALILNRIIDKRKS